MHTHSHQRLWKLTRLVPAPEFVQSVEDAAEIYGNEKTAAHLCADPMQRSYPCHTPAATWVSYLMCLDDASSSPKYAADRLMKTAADIERFGGVHGITAELDAVKKAMAPAEIDNDALPDSVFAAVFDVEGKKMRRMRMLNHLEVKKAADYLAGYRKSLHFHEASGIAERILQRADELQTVLSEDQSNYLNKQAGYGTCVPSEAVEHLKVRLSRTVVGSQTKGETQEKMAELIESVQSNPLCMADREFRIRLAETVDGFDRHTKLAAEVRDGYLPAVEDVFFHLTPQVMQKAASAHASTITGNVYALDDLEVVKLADVRAYLGDDIADAMTDDGLRVSAEKAADVIPTLDRQVARQFDQLMEAVGAGPTAKEASDAAVVQRQPSDISAAVAKYRAAKRL